ncbi:hypothetical protein BJY52DRAFT_1416667 [Lactarius psammicola]|nr:hypothetical protein BJY52DRAFT_1416667 [Lactarius psammicola]
MFMFPREGDEPHDVLSVVSLKPTLGVESSSGSDPFVLGPGYEAVGNGQVPQALPGKTYDSSPSQSAPTTPPFSAPATTQSDIAASSPSSSTTPPNMSVGSSAVSASFLSVMASISASLQPSSTTYLSDGAWSSLTSSILPTSTSHGVTTTTSLSSSITSSTLPSVSTVVPAAAIRSDNGHGASFWAGIALLSISGTATFITLFAWWLRMRSRTRRRPWDPGWRWGRTESYKFPEDAISSSGDSTSLWQQLVDRKVAPAVLGQFARGPHRVRPLPMELRHSDTSVPGVMQDIGSLHVANLVAGDIHTSGDESSRPPTALDDVGTPRESSLMFKPRYLSLNGSGLDVPWIPTQSLLQPEPNRPPPLPPPRPPNLITPLSGNRWKERLERSSAKPAGSSNTLPGAIEIWRDSLRNNITNALGVFASTTLAPSTRPGLSTYDMGDPNAEVAHAASAMSVASKPWTFEEKREGAGIVHIRGVPNAARAVPSLHSTTTGVTIRTGRSLPPTPTSLCLVLPRRSPPLRGSLVPPRLPHLPPLPQVPRTNAVRSKSTKGQHGSRLRRPVRCSSSSASSATSVGSDMSRSSVGATMARWARLSEKEQAARHALRQRRLHRTHGAPFGTYWQPDPRRGSDWDRQWVTEYSKAVRQGHLATQYTQLSTTLHSHSPLLSMSGAHRSSSGLPDSLDALGGLNSKSCHRRIGGGNFLYESSEVGLTATRTQDSTSYSLVRSPTDEVRQFWLSPFSKWAFTRSSILFISLIISSFDTFVESPNYQEASYGFYHPATVQIANTLADMPFSATRILIYDIIVYFMTHLARSVGGFPRFTSNYDTALWVAVSIFPNLVHYAGYMIPINRMKRWLFWICRIRPKPDDLWRRNFVTLFAFLFFFWLTQTVVIELYPQFVEGGGISFFDRDTAQTKELDSALKERRAKKAEDNAFPDRMAFTWERLNYHVPVTDGTSQLLDNVYAYVNQDTLTALMGAPGGGKMTRLDVLAQRKNIGVVSGDILVDRRPLDVYFTSGMRMAMRLSAYLRKPFHVPKEEWDGCIEDMLELLEIQDLSEALRLASAWNLVPFLCKLADNGQAILCRNLNTTYFGDIDEDSNALWRPPAYVFTRLFSHLIMSLLVSLPFLQLGHSDRDPQYPVITMLRVGSIPHTSSLGIRYRSVARGDSIFGALYTHLLGVDRLSDTVLSSGFGSGSKITCKPEDFAGVQSVIWPNPRDLGACFYNSALLPAIRTFRPY